MSPKRAWRKGVEGVNFGRKRTASGLAQFLWTSRALNKGKRLSTRKAHERTGMARSAHLVTGTPARSGINNLPAVWAIYVARALRLMFEAIRLFVEYRELCVGQVCSTFVAVEVVGVERSESSCQATGYHRLATWNAERTKSFGIVLLTEEQMILRTQTKKNTTHSNNKEGNKINSRRFIIKEKNWG